MIDIDKLLANQEAMLTVMNKLMTVVERLSDRLSILEDIHGYQSVPTTRG